MTEHPALRPDMPLDQALTTAARDMLVEARDTVSGPSQKTDEAIHDLRKAIKRWRAFLRLIEPHIGSEARGLRAAARDLAKTVSGARDLRAMLDAIALIRKGRHRPDETVLDAVAARIEEMQTEAESGIAGALDRQAIAAEIERWLDRAGQWPFAGIGFQDIFEALETSYRRARKAQPEKWRDADDGELHEFRRRTIDHRYHLELLEALLPGAAKRAEEMQALRDALGRHRDLALLESAMERDPALAHHREAVVPAITKHQRRQLTHAREIAERAFAAKPRDFRTRMCKPRRGQARPHPE